MAKHRPGLTRLIVTKMQLTLLLYQKYFSMSNSCGLQDAELDLSQKANQNECTPSEPRNEGMYLADYVNGKILGEELSRNHKNYVIVRPGQIYGFGANGEMDVRMKRIQGEISKNGKMVRSANVNISIIHVNDLADCIVELFDSDYIGTLCVASDKIVSYFEFYQFLSEQIGISGDKIIPEYSNEFSAGYFDTTKAQSLLKSNIRNISAVHLR